MVVVRYINENSDTKVSEYEFIQQFMDDASIDNYKLLDVSVHGIYADTKGCSKVKDIK